MIHERMRPFEGAPEPAGVAPPKREALGQAIRCETLHSDTFPGRPLQTLQLRIEVPAGAEVSPHRHPGVEIGYVVSGRGELGTPHLPPTPLAPGASFGVPRLTAHSLHCKGADPLVVVATYIVEMDLPLTSPVD